MKNLITYSSKTGNTEKIARGIYEVMDSEITEILPIEKVYDIEKYENIIVGYWVDKGMPNKEAKEFMEKIENKNTGVFATLGAYPDSQHGQDSLQAGVDILTKNNNKVLGKFICQGKVSEKLIEFFNTLPLEHPHGMNPERIERLAAAASHPNDDDVKNAQEVFRKGFAL